MLKQLARTDPYYKRNRPHVCSFFAKGECKRGEECPYRHEMPAEGSSQGSTQKSIQNRYHGTSDPVAKKLLTSYAESQGLAPPDDTDITSLFLSSLPETATEASVRTTIVQTIPTIDPQKIRSVVHVAKSRCAFANFRDRETAELAAVSWAKGLEIDGVKVGVKWGRSRPTKPPINEIGPSGSSVSATS
jgi:pre-mRNA-splicing factor RBM22/SLT11